MCYVSIVIYDIIYSLFPRHPPQAAHLARSVPKTSEVLEAPDDLATPEGPDIGTFSRSLRRREAIINKHCAVSACFRGPKPVKTL